MCDSPIHWSHLSPNFFWVSASFFSIKSSYLLASCSSAAFACLSPLALWLACPTCPLLSLAPQTPPKPLITLRSWSGKLWKRVLWLFHTHSKSIAASHQMNMLVLVSDLFFDCFKKSLHTSTCWWGPSWCVACTSPSVFFSIYIQDTSYHAFHSSWWA